jgi:hypothetical protein
VLLAALCGQLQLTVEQAKRSALLATFLEGVDDGEGAQQLKQGGVVSHSRTITAVEIMAPWVHDLCTISRVRWLGSEIADIGTGGMGESVLLVSLVLAVEEMDAAAAIIPPVRWDCSFASWEPR